mgnify:CR=1 FL=1
MIPTTRESLGRNFLSSPKFRSTLIYIKNQPFLPSHFKIGSNEKGN